LHGLWARQQDLLTADPRAALRLAEWMVSIALDLDNPSLKAMALRAKGNALITVDDYHEALDHFEKALKIFRKSGDELEIARTMMNRVVGYLRLSRFDEALADADRVTEMFQKLGDERRLGAHLVNVGNIYFRLDRFNEHLAILERAEEILSRMKDARALCRLHTNRAVVLTGLNRAEEALKSYELARRLAAENDMPLLVSQCDYNICYLYFLQGQYTKALEMLNAVRKHMNECGDRWHSALCNLDQSEIYLELNMHHDAIELADQAYNGFEALGMAYEMAKAVTFKGIAQNHLHNYGKALELFDRSRSMFIQQGNEVWLSLIDLYQGIIYFQTGRYFEGIELARKAHQFFSKAQLKTKAVYAQLLVARLELQLGNPQKAWTEVQAASKALGEEPAPWLGYQIHYVTGDILKRQARLDEAGAAFRKAVSELEVLRTNIHVDELRMTFLKDKLKIYEGLVRCALDVGDPSSLREAFEAVEHAKSRTLVDLLANNINSVHPNRESDSELVEYLRTIREELNWYYTRINIEEQKKPPRSDETLRTLTAEVHKRENQLMKLLRQVSGEPSEYVTLQRVVTSSLDEIQASIPTDTVLIEFYVVEERIIAFAITHDGFRVFPNITLEDAVRRNFDLLRFQLTKFNLGPEYVKRFDGILLTSVKEHLHDLYRDLIPPIQDALEGKRAIIFVPHGLMHYLPFHALFDGERYLIDRYEISYSPSATIFRSCTPENERAAGGSPLIIGVPDVRAPEILDEVKNIAAVLENATVLIGAEATTASVQDHVRSAGIVHIASHGSFRNDNPMFSSIQLGDSWLSLFDIYNLKTSADLVTLSGCGTGMSKVIGGDELIGLVRGFLYSGARSLVVSLWDVHDRATADLMKTFYSQLAAGESRWSSLRYAVLALKERQPHPYYWAPFIGIGAS
jgi:tetratricopeptide (TPR) repeat protein